jgi:hypothetical protein
MSVEALTRRAFTRQHVLAIGRRTPASADASSIRKIFGTLATYNWFEHVERALTLGRSTAYLLVEVEPPVSDVPPLESVSEFEELPPAAEVPPIEVVPPLVAGFVTFIGSSSFAQAEINENAIKTTTELTMERVFISNSFVKTPEYRSS